MKLLNYLLLLSFVLGGSALMADDNESGNSSENTQSEDVVVSGTVISVDEDRRIISVAGKTIHMPALGNIPYKKGQSVSVVTTRIKGKIYYIARHMSEQGG